METKILIAPDGNREIFMIENVEAALDAGYMTEEAWNEAQTHLIEQKYQEWLATDEGRDASRRKVDMATSAKILAGFDYEIDGQTLHFSYDSYDQQNFADTANACLLSKSGLPGLPQTVNWNAYKPDGELVRLTLDADAFLELYVAGALAHKAACMEEGGLKKAEIAGNAD